MSIVSSLSVRYPDLSPARRGVRYLTVPIIQGEDGLVCLGTFHIKDFRLGKDPSFLEMVSLFLQWLPDFKD